MQTIDPTLVTALTGMSVGVLMVHAGVVKRLAAGDAVVAAVWHPRHARFVVQMSITERR